jgi:hypothetical protein
MALIRSSLVSSISGSIAGTTYARNRGGSYARNRTNPIQPRSPSQMRARSQLSFNSKAWSTSLTPTQRESWVSYAASLPSLNRIGESIVLTGQQAYVQANTLLQLSGQSPVVAPPTGPSNFVIETAVGPVYDVSAKTLSVTEIAGIVSDGLLLAFTSPPQSPGSLSRKVPFRLFGVTSVTNLDDTATIVADANARAYAVSTFFTVRLLMVSAAGAFSQPFVTRSGASIA